MTFNRHGRIGANLYIIFFAIIVIPPGFRILKTLGIVYFLAVACLVIPGAWVNARAIIRYGGGTAGEMLGLLSGVLVLIATWVAAKIWIMIDVNTAWTDPVRLVTASIASFLMALSLSRIGVKPGVSNGK